MDSLGYNTLLYDYQHDLDPNIIDFAVIVTNNYVNSSLVSLPLTIMAGEPFYAAVLVGDTNTADAVWLPYTSSNLVVNLGSTNGVYSVQVGLRGMPTNSQQTWQTVQLTLDALLPVLVITNPVTGTVFQPIIQVQGYADLPLNSLTFDVSNAAAIFTNQTGYVTGQFYDTNLMEFTTNYFQCYDVPLALGLNTITIHAVDVFGEGATTNFNITLNYSGDTTPPTLSVTWPQNGTYISGNSFTFQGFVDDDTATVTAQITDTTGDTNTVQGLVERDGKVSINNLPVSAGANYLTVTATDAAGNSATTNLTVTQSSVTVTMDPLSSDQANHSSVSVTGTISDPSGDVCIQVNGTNAYYLDDYGDWEADNVPVSPIGEATFDVELYTGDPLNIGSEVFSQAQSPLVTLANYQQNAAVNAIDGYDKNKLHWNYAGGGGWSIDYANSNPNSADASSTFPPDGTNYMLPIVSYGYYFTTPVGNKWWGWGGQFSPTWQSAEETFDEDGTAYQESIQTTLMIVPSGPKLPDVTKTYCVRVCAMSYSDPGRDDYSYWFLNVTPLNLGDTPMPPDQLQVNGNALINSGITNDDGSVWGETIVSAPAGVNAYVTPEATQVDQNWDYTFSLQALDITHVLAVDNNRDGQITFDDTDATTPNNPYRFWINDSQESGDIASGADAQIPESSTPNCNTAQVQGSSDLVNYFPVVLSLSNVIQWLPPSQEGLNIAWYRMTRR